MKTKIHAFAGALALITLITFWSSTLLVEFFGTYEQIAQVKTGILYGLLLLIPAMMVTGGSGFNLAGKRKGKILDKKKKRMKIIGINGVVILIPSALFLAFKAGSADFDIAFYTVQAVELIAGMINIAFLIQNMKAGLLLTRKRNAPYNPVIVNTK